MLILMVTETGLVKENIVSVTIRDVAQFCGVSVSTVSRVLNGYTDISEETANKVFEAIKKLDFVPNNTARMLLSTYFGEMRAAANTSARNSAVNAYAVNDLISSTSTMNASVPSSLVRGSQR